MAPSKLKFSAATWRPVLRPRPLGDITNAAINTPAGGPNAFYEPHGPPTSSVWSTASTVCPGSVAPFEATFSVLSREVTPTGAETPLRLFHFATPPPASPSPPSTPRAGTRPHSPFVFTPRGHDILLASPTAVPVPPPAATPVPAQPLLPPRPVRPRLEPGRGLPLRPCSPRRPGTVPMTHPLPPKPTFRARPVHRRRRLDDRVSDRYSPYASSHRDWRYSSRREAYSGRERKVWITGVPLSVTCGQLKDYLQRKVGAVRSITIDDDGAMVTFEREVAAMARRRVDGRWRLKVDIIPHRRADGPFVSRRRP